MSNVPSDLRSWTIEHVRDLVADGLGESDLHDFKLQLPDAATLSKAFCSFANATGGFLVFGVGQTPAGWQVVGIPQDSEFRAKVSQKLRVEPFLPWHGPKALPTGVEGRAVYVVHVPASPNRPHCPTTSEFPTFMRRAAGTAKAMTLEEIRSQVLRTEERRIALRLLAIELQEAARVTMALRRQADPGHAIVTFDVENVDRLFAEAFSFIADDERLLADLLALRRNMKRVAIVQRHLMDAAAHAVKFSDGGRSGHTMIHEHLNGMGDPLRSCLIVLREKYGVETVQDWAIQSW